MATVARIWKEITDRPPVDVGLSFFMIKERSNSDHSFYY